MSDSSFVWRDFADSTLRLARVGQGYAILKVSIQRTRKGWKEMDSDYTICGVRLGDEVL